MTRKVYHKKIAAHNRIPLPLFPQSVKTTSHLSLASNKLLRVKFPLSRDKEDHVMSVSPSSERIERLWVMYAYG